MEYDKKNNELLYKKKQAWKDLKAKVGDLAVVRHQGGYTHPYLISRITELGFYISSTSFREHYMKGTYVKEVIKTVEIKGNIFKYHIDKKEEYFITDNKLRVFLILYNIKFKEIPGKIILENLSDINKLNLCTVVLNI